MTINRWRIAVAGVVMQIALGAVYAWSVFRVPLSKQFGWSISEVTLTFTICIFVLGIASFFGGLWLSRGGPRVVALTGGTLYGAGLILASFSNNGLWWLYLSYGVVGGIGLGFSYIVPIAVLVKWFPDRRGLVTGIAVAGFGAGALITAPVATRLILSVGVLETFAYLGIAFLIVTVGSGWTKGIVITFPLCRPSSVGALPRPVSVRLMPIVVVPTQVPRMTSVSPRDALFTAVCRSE